MDRTGIGGGWTCLVITKRKPISPNVTIPKIIIKGKVVTARTEGHRFPGAAFQMYFYFQINKPADVFSLPVCFALWEAISL